MPKQADKKTVVNKTAANEAQPAGYHWKIRPEPAATPRDRRWLLVSLTALLAWLAALVWLAFR